MLFVEDILSTGYLMLKEVILSREILLNIEIYIKSITDGRGADVVIECAGVKATFDMSWKIARPNGTVSILALYGKTQELPLQIMGGKNLTIRSGWVDSTHMPELMSLIESGKLNTDFLITHEAPLNDILKGYDVFGNKKDNVLKWVVTSYIYENN